MPIVTTMPPDSKFTCPLNDCRKQVIFYGYLEKERIRKHVFEDCSSPKIKDLISQSFDDGKKIKKGIHKREKLQCPLQYCGSRFSTPEKWVKHLAVKHQGLPLITWRHQVLISIFTFWLTSSSFFYFSPDYAVSLRDFFRLNFLTGLAVNMTSFIKMTWKDSILHTCILL